jgi:spore germination protein
MCRVKIYSIVLCTILLLLTGCWDRVEIEDRGFNIGVAIDLAEEREIESDKPQGEYLFKGTYQIVVPGGLQQESGVGSKTKAYQNLTSTSDTMFEQVRNLAEETSRSPFLKHLQLIIVSDEVAQKPKAFANILDLFLRDHEMRRGVTVFISNGEAGPILDVDPMPENLPVMFINSISENARKQPKMLPETRVGDIHEHLVDHSSFLVPQIKLIGDQVKIEGAAVFHGHNNRMEEFITGEETEGVRFIIGEYQGGPLKTIIENNLVVYEVKRANSKIEVRTENKEQMEFTINIQTEGNIVESFKTLDYTKPEVMEKVRANLEKEIERIAQSAIDKLHGDLQVDALQLGGYVERKDYNTWKEVKDNWDHGENYFAKSTIKVNAEVMIRTSGSVIQSKK